MEVTYRIDKDILYIAIDGRIDVSNAAEAEEKIFAIKNENKDKHTVVDADKLEYISSAGLRVILKLRKEDPKLAIINVAAALTTDIVKPHIITISIINKIDNPHFKYLL